MNTGGKASLSSVIVIEMPIHSQDRGFLVVAQGGNEPNFSIARVFMVCAQKNEVRGRHSHKRCSQLLVCFTGEILVTCTDGAIEREFLLNEPNSGLLIPPGIWSEQKYLTENSVLIVLCDRIYEEDDYIREFSDFLDYRKGNISE